MPRRLSPRFLSCSVGRRFRAAIVGPLLSCLALLTAPFAFPLSLDAADVAWREGYEAPEPSWVLLGPAEAKLLSRQRRQGNENGVALYFESITTSAPAGLTAQVAQPVPKAPLIDEFRATVRIRSPQAGLRIGVEVVCPRSTDKGLSEPARLLVTGTRYIRPGTWQTLVADDLPRAAKRQARFQKTASGAPFDLQEAYVDRVVLILPGGPKPTAVDIDEAALHGVIFAPARAVRQAAHTVDPVEAPILEGPLLESVLASPAAPEIRRVEVARRGETITVSGAPLLPRIARHHGEPMTRLAELGFNTVWLDHVPTAQELADAYQARLWVIAPPPDAEVLKNLPAQSPWQAVLAWSLGRDRTAIDLDATRSLAETTRLADQQFSRPLVVGTLDRRRTYAQLADIVVDSRTPWSSDHAPSASVRLLGCARWVAVETQQSPLAQAQSLAFAPSQPELAWHPPLMIRQLAVESVADGARGLLIEAGDSLAGQQAPVRSLAIQLELLHRELSLLEPWLVGGKTVAGASVDRRAELVPRSWQLERARLVMVPPHAPPAPPASPIETLTVAGVPETASAHLVTTAGLVPLEVHRVTGGLRVVVGDMSAGSLLLLTDDQRAIAQLHEHTSKHAQRSARGERDLAMGELVALDTALQETWGRDREPTADPLAHGKGMLQQCDLLLASRDYPRALQLARTLRYAVHRQSQLAQNSGTTAAYRHESWPIRQRPAAWGSARALRQAADSLPRGPNFLPAGDFEQLDQARGAGWTHLHYDSQAWHTSVALVADSPRHGAAALRLTAAAVPGQVSDVAPWQPLVWINSPTLPFPQGATVEITGWARLETPGTLVVSDSLGGEELALRIEETNGWEQFRAIRSVGPTGVLSLRIGLVGTGQADVDAVMIRQILPPSRQVPATAGATPARPR